MKTVAIVAINEGNPRCYATGTPLGKTPGSPPVVIAWRCTSTKKEKKRKKRKNEKNPRLVSNQGGGADRVSAKFSASSPSLF